MDDILVSVSMLAYNHEKYVAQAIESVLMQETNFKFEILIHEDASTDGTADIIREYEKKYPDIIKPIYQTENQYSKGNNQVGRIQIPRHTRKYVAVCECDDYWTDKHKLQKEVDFLENNPEYIAVCHNVRCVDENGIHKDELQIYPIEEAHDIDFDSFLTVWDRWMVVGQFVSLVYRNVWLDMSDEMKNEYFDCRANGDEKLSMLLVNLGKIRHMSEIMADHRRVIKGGSSWTARTQNRNMFGHFYNSKKSISEFVKKMFGRDLHSEKALDEIVCKAILRAIKSRNKEDIEIAKEIFKDSSSKMYIVKKLFNKMINKVIRKNANID